MKANKYFRLDYSKVLNIGRIEKKTCFQIGNN